MFGATYLALVLLVPTFVGFRDLAAVIEASPSSRPPLWAGTEGLFALQHVLFSVGLSCWFVCVVLATYHSSVVRRALHLGSFAVLLELFYRLAYRGGISAGVMLSVGETSQRESWELIAGHPLLSTVLSLVLAAACYAVVSTWRTRHRFTAACYVPFGLAALLMNATALAIVWHEARGPSLDAGLFFEQLKGVFPIDIAAAAQAVAANALEAHESEIVRRNFKFPNARRMPAAAGASRREIYFIVIGETSRRGNWSLFGYPRNTTPRLDALRDDLVVFGHITSNATNTIQSLPLALSRAQAGDVRVFHTEKSIVGLLRQTGFDTFWISNQERANSRSNAVSQIALEAAHVSFSDDLSREAPGTKWDSDLLKRIDAEIEALPATGKAVFFVHMEGSHFNYADRYPARSRRFQDTDQPPRSVAEAQRRLVNEYDNSIVFTDEMLSGMIQRLTVCACRSGLLYFSDHGERLFDKGSSDPEFGHGFPSVSRQEIEIPLFIFLSSPYREDSVAGVASLRANSAAVGELHNVFETIVDLTGVTYEGRRADLSLFSSDFKSVSILSVLDVNQRQLLFPVDDGFGAN